MTTTAANVHDATELGELLHGAETRVYGDQAFQGQTTVIRAHAPNAKDFTNRRCRYRGVVDAVQRGKNRTKSRVRAKVKHSIGVVKRVFGYAKVRYRGLAKNRQRLWLSCGLVNLFIVRRRLLRT
jgi:transposase, IS5 family